MDVIPRKSTETNTSGLMLAGMILLLLIATMVLIGGYATSWGGRMNLAKAASILPNTNGTAHATLNLTIVTGEMMGQGAQGPAYVPSNFTVPPTPRSR